MNLTREQIAEINTHLASPKIDIPPFRREVTITGGNVQWLQKHLTKNNPKLPARLTELLGLKT
jgi:hypothetical protein